MHSRVSQVVLVVKNLPANAGDMRCSFDPWVGKIPWRRAWATHSSILAWRILMDRGAWQANSPWGHKELDMTEHTHTHHLQSHSYYFLATKLSALPM